MNPAALGLKHVCSEEIKRQAQAFSARCTGAAEKKQPPGPPKCTEPPAGSVQRHSPSFACVTAKNTNKDPRCIYSFTYILSTKGSQPGGNVAADSSEERCTSQVGVDISFGKWTRNVGAAR